MATTIRLFFLALLLCTPGALTAQQQQVDRKPAVAGQFYPEDPHELRRTLKRLFAAAAPHDTARTVLALIVPHAGYVYSGEVAASGFNQLNPNTKYDNIFIVGSSHHMRFEGAAVYCSGDFITPLGTVKVNRALGKALATHDEFSSTLNEAHRLEHSIEVQLPFLQTRLKNEFQIVPILLGTDSPEICRKIAEVLHPYFSGHNLFVISSDFSHYPTSSDAIKVDKATAQAILSNSPEGLTRTLEQNGRSGIFNLATSLCGWTSVLTLLDMTAAERDLAYHTIQYKNSGDSPFGTKDRVVGYYAIVASRIDGPRPSSFYLSPTEQTTLLAVARRTIRAYLSDQTAAPVEPAELTEALKSRYGAFVTLTEHEMLRGCIGTFEAKEPLYAVVQQMAIASATQDVRFKPVALPELDNLRIEISVLSPMQRINSIDEFQLGRHGIYIRKGSRGGTFLPQVAAETGWTKEEFLGHCSRDKAGIGWEGWKDADLYVYEAFVFGEQKPPVVR